MGKELPDNFVASVEWKSPVSITFRATTAVAIALLAYWCGFMASMGVRFADWVVK